MVGPRAPKKKAPIQPKKVNKTDSSGVGPEHVAQLRAMEIAGTLDEYVTDYLEKVMRSHDQGALTGEAAVTDRTAMIIALLNSLTRATDPDGL